MADVVGAAEAAVDLGEVAHAQRTKELVPLLVRAHRRVVDPLGRREGCASSINEQLLSERGRCRPLAWPRQIRRPSALHGSRRRWQRPAQLLSLLLRL